MAVFFFVVGLEIKREVWVGELSNLRAALLPIIAATGGAVVPALIYTAINLGRESASGWGIPMATDIAFALGVLALLGSRIPFSLKIFLTAVAIVDDLIAVLVVAIFYSSGVHFMPLLVGLGLLGVLFAANLLGMRALLFYYAVGVLIWLAFLELGVHATIAGVLVALTLPARNRIDPTTFLQRARRLLDRFETTPMEFTPMLKDEMQQALVLELEDVMEAVQAPLQKAEHSLQKWVAFVIMPVFAVANAGIVLSASSVASETLPVSLGIIAGLVVGKPVGLLLASWAIVKTGLSALPEGIGWQQIVGVACLAGIGFTMSLFIAALGFDSGPLLEAAKLGILTASLVAGATGYILLRRTHPAAR